MRTLMILIMMAGLTLAHVDKSLAQVKDPVKQTEKEGERRVNRGVDKTIDKGFDKMEEGIGSLFKKKNKKDKNDSGKEAEGQEHASDTKQADAAGSSAGQQSDPALNWAKYDFVPGDKIIFEDNLLGEENGEFPSRWDLVQGNVEIAQLNGENVIMFRAGLARIIPYLKNPEKDYLPGVFTVEFDLYLGDGSFEIFLYDLKNQTSGNHSNWSSFIITSDNQMAWANSYSKLPGNPLPKKRWVHIAIAYTSGKLKGYIDDTRLVNIPHLSFDPTGITFSNYIFGTKEDGFYFVKNVRIAEGGVKYYDRFLQDGKIVSNGIRFDVAKASLRPESMGVMNEIYKMLSEHPDIAVSVEGHTDSDGDNDLNQKLSEERAKTVMNQLISMGIDAGKLSFKGFGESKPIASNDTPEGKASNRRVEFVKK